MPGSARGLVLTLWFALWFAAVGAAWVGMALFHPELPPVAYVLLVVGMAVYGGVGLHLFWVAAARGVLRVLTALVFMACWFAAGPAAWAGVAMIPKEVGAGAYGTVTLGVLVVGVVARVVIGCAFEDADR